ncbi:MAG: hypothetical protein PHF86_02080 [Candidatus Nanoarchaeia archaeon]|jgi:hypothetical protein|nr:hypothetical protein [Candidatus Nanoarchaeia archaeon]
MLRDSLLADRLNMVKEGKEIPKLPTKEIKIIQDTIPTQPEPILPLMSLSVGIYHLIEFTGISILYGIGLKTIFSANWSFLGLLGVGVLTHRIINLLSKLKLFK